MKRLNVMTGVPGCGKSTFITNHLREHPGLVISRDFIRFALLDPESDEYFKHESEVLKEFYKQINYLISTYDGDIFVDATHLTPQARRRLFSNINWKDTDEVIGYYFTTPLEVCLERNKKRSGREVVPEKVIRDMYARMKPPTVFEKPYNEIRKVNEDGVVFGGEF